MRVINVQKHTFGSARSIPGTRYRTQIENLIHGIRCHLSGFLNFIIQNRIKSDLYTFTAFLNTKCYTVTSYVYLTVPG